MRIARPDVQGRREGKVTSALVLLSVPALVHCGGAPHHPGLDANPTTVGAPEPPRVARGGTSTSAVGTQPGTPLSDDGTVAFRDAFDRAELGAVWNVFGEAPGRREVLPTAQGLWVKVLRAERAWDAVGVRTARARVNGDFDLRGRLRDFGAAGNGSAKLIVVDAAAPRGEAAYVERIQIDGKNLFKFGGDVGGSLETWGMAPNEARGGDLRLERKGARISGYFRTAETGPWTVIGAPATAPGTMPRVLKFGVKTSAAAERDAQARWTEITLNGEVQRTE